MALLASAAAMALTPLWGRWLPRPAAGDGDKAAIDPGAPDIALAQTARSGPIVVEIDCCIDPDEARAFYGEMQKAQQTRHRNGACNWSISRDIAEPSLWKERFQCAIWLDYLRLWSRHTSEELEFQCAAEIFHHGDESIKVRRMLERPFGSARWKHDAPDIGPGDVLPTTAT